MKCKVKVTEKSVVQIYPTQPHLSKGQWDWSNSPFSHEDWYSESYSCTALTWFYSRIGYPTMREIQIILLLASLTHNHGPGPHSSVLNDSSTFNNESSCFANLNLANTSIWKCFLSQTNLTRCFPVAVSTLCVLKLKFEMFVQCCNKCFVLPFFKSSTVVRTEL